MVSHARVERGEPHAEVDVFRHHLDEPSDLLEGRVPAARALEELLDVERGLDERGIGLEGLPEPAQGVVDAVLVGVDEADVVAGLGVERLDREHLLELVNRALVVARDEEGKAVLVHRLDPARPGLHRLLVLLERLFVLAQRVVGEAEVVVERGVVRVDLEALPEDPHGLLGIAHGAIDRAEVVVCEHVLGIELDGLRVGHLGHLEVARLPMRVAQGEEGLGVVGIGGEGLLEGVDRVLGLAQPEVGGAGAEERLHVPCLPGEDAREGREGLGGAIGAEVYGPEHDARLVGLRRLDEAGPGVALGRLEIAEEQGPPSALELRHAALVLLLDHLAVLEGRAEVSGENSPARASARSSAAPVGSTREPGAAS